jgi:hypothetical protein
MAYHARYHNWRQTGGFRTDNQKDFYARTAAIAYGKNAEDRLDKMKKYKMEGWELDPLSNPDVAILHNPKTNEVIAAVAGTRLNTAHKWRDLRSDAMIAIGLEKKSSRAPNVEKVIREAQKKYGSKADYTISGHSLGSSQGKIISDKLGIQGIFFNRGSSPANSNPVSAAWNKLFGKQSKAITYSVAHDPLSASATAFGNEKTKHIVPAKDILKPHTIDNFIDQEGGGKKQSAWIAHVKKYQQKNNVSYKHALKLASASYTRYIEKV